MKSTVERALEEKEIQAQMRKDFAIIMLMPLYPASEDGEPLFDPAAPDFVRPDGWEKFEQLLSETCSMQETLEPVSLGTHLVRFEELRREFAHTLGYDQSSRPIVERLIFPRLATRVHLLRRQMSRFFELEQKRESRDTPARVGQRLHELLNEVGMSDGWLSNIYASLRDANALLVTASSMHRTVHNLHVEANAALRAERDRLRRALENAVKKSEFDALKAEVMSAVTEVCALQAVAPSPPAPAAEPAGAAAAAAAAAAESQ